MHSSAVARPSSRGHPSRPQPGAGNQRSTDREEMMVPAAVSTPPASRWCCPWCWCRFVEQRRSGPRTRLGRLTTHGFLPGATTARRRGAASGMPRPAASSSPALGLGGGRELGERAPQRLAPPIHASLISCGHSFRQDFLVAAWSAPWRWRCHLGGRWSPLARRVGFNDLAALSRSLPRSKVGPVAPAAWRPTRPASSCQAPGETFFSRAWRRTAW